MLACTSGDTQADSTSSTAIDQGRKEASSTPSNATVEYKAMEGAGVRAYSAEVQLASYPTEGAEIEAAIRALLLSAVRSLDRPCSIFFRIHSPQSSVPLVDADADMGKMLATASKTCDGPSEEWTWESHVSVVSEPKTFAKQDEVVAGKAKAFGFIPIPVGSTFKKTNEYPNSIGKQYQTSLPLEAVRDFYRKAMIKVGCREDVFIADVAGSYVCSKGTFEIDWQQVGRFEVSKNSP